MTENNDSSRVKSSSDRVVSEKLICRLSSKSDNKYYPPLPSSDNCNIAYGVDLTTFFSTKSFAVLNQDKQKDYLIIGPYSITFSPNGKKLVYSAARKPKKKTRKRRNFFAVCNQNESPQQYCHVDNLLFSPDSKKLSYLANDGEKNFIVLEDNELPPFETIEWFSTRFSPDSKKLSYLASKGYKHLLMMNEEELYSCPTIAPVVFSPNSTRTIFHVKSDGKRFMVVDGEEQQPFESFVEFSSTFSPDSKRFGYVANKNNRSFVVIDGTEYDSYDYITDFHFGPDSKSTAFMAAAKDKRFVVVDGKREHNYSGLISGSLTYSPDGRSIAFVARKGNQQVVVINEQEQEPFDWIKCLTFSPNGKFFVYFAGVNDKFCTVVNRTRGPLLEGRIMEPEIEQTSSSNMHKLWKMQTGSIAKRGITFSSNKSFHYLYQRNRNVFLVEETLL